MIAFANTKTNLPNFKNDGRVNVYLSVNHFQQNLKSFPNINNAVNIYCVYKLDPIALTGYTSYTIQSILYKL